MVDKLAFSVRVQASSLCAFPLADLPLDALCVSYSTILGHILDALCASYSTILRHILDALCASYSTILRHILDDQVPARAIIVVDCLKLPWFDNDCQNCRRLARLLERRYRLSKSQQYLNAWKDQLLAKRTLYAQKTSSYWTNLIQACAGNSKHLWDCLNRIMLRSDSPSAQSNITAEQLAMFFVHKVETICASMQQCQPPSLTIQQGHSMTVFKPFSLAEICRTIQCSPSKLCSLDPLPFSLLLTSLEQILPFYS